MDPINRERLVLDINKKMPGKDIVTAMSDTIDGVLKIIADQPSLATVDAIMYCGDCLHYDEENGKCLWHNSNVGHHDFCSFAEEKEDEDEDEEEEDE